MYLILRDQYDPGKEVMDYLHRFAWRKIFITKDGKFKDVEQTITRDLKFYKMVVGI